jgi:hypothetical protein
MLDPRKIHAWIANEAAPVALEGALRDLKTE